MSSVESQSPSPSPADDSRTGTLPIFSRKSTGLVRQLSLTDMTIFNFGSSIPFGFGFGVFLTVLFAFPRSNPYVTIMLAVVPAVLFSICFALMTAMIPRIGGDYAINSRILPPWLAFGGNVCVYIASLLGIPFIAYLASTLGISSVLATIGTVSDSHTLVTWSNYFTPQHRWGIFIASVVLAFVVTVLSAMGTKVIMRAFKYCIILGLIGVAADMAIILFSTHHGFVRDVDTVAGAGTYSKVAHLGVKQGLSPAVGGYSTKNTVGAIYYGLAVLGTLWWGTYLSAEFRGARQRRRQLISMIVPVLAFALLVVLCLSIMTKTIGYDFLASTLNGNFPEAGNAVAGAGYVYFGGLITGSTVLSVLLGVCFLAWFVPGIYLNAAQNHRGILAWSFDGLLPQSLAKVSDRTHAPTRAIWLTFILAVPLCAWSSFSANFFTILGYAFLFVFPPIILIGGAAIIVKARRPELYHGSPAEVEAGGIAWLPIIGALTMIAGIGTIVLSVYFAKQLAVSGWKVAVAPVLVIAVCAFWWYGARAIRRREGIDMDKAYQTIPPE